MKPDKLIWKPASILTSVMGQEERRDILQAILQDGPARLIDNLERRVGTERRMRYATISALPLGRKVQQFETVLGAASLQEPLEKALAWFLLTKRSSLVTAFLDACGITQKAGVIDAGTPPPSAEQAGHAVSRLVERFARHDVALYLTTTGLVMGPAWQEVLWPLASQLQDSEATTRPAETGTPERPRLPEDNVAFTTLDNLLIKTIVAALGDIEGALDLDQARDLVEEVLRLNPDRHRSYFHKGFLDTLIGEAPDQPFPEENSSRRGWLLAGGIMALARRGDPKGIRALFNSRRPAFVELMRTPPVLPAAVMAAGPVFEALADAGAYADAVNVITAEVAAQAGIRFLGPLLATARDLFLSRRTADASLVIELLDHAIKHLDDDALPEEFLSDFERRRAQLLRARGHFAEAEKEFAAIRDNYPESYAALMLADIALCRGSFKWLSDVEVPRQQAAVADMLRRLEAAAEPAQQSLAVADGPKTNAQFILGVRSLLRGANDEGRSFLEDAYAGMSQRDDLYRDALPKCRVYYALSILRSLNEPQFTIAREILEATADGAELAEWPEWLLIDAFQVAHLSLAEGVPLTEWLSRRFPHLLEDFLHNPELLNRSDSLLAALKARAANAARPLERRWRDQEVLVGVARARQDLSLMRAALDGLEELTFLSPVLRARFIQYLNDQSHYDPAWTWDEAEMTRALMHEAAAAYADAATVLAALVHHYLSRDAIDDARAVHERLKSYGGACPVFPDVEARMHAIADERGTPEIPSSASLCEGSPIRILFIGGDERQARQDPWIQSELARDFKRVRVRFEHTGWGSNWGASAERIRQLIADHDAIILMPFIRTEFGRTVREDAGRSGKRWFPCTGRGREWMLRSIIHAARSVVG